MEIINFNKAVNTRFETVIKNIKSASNSFYDSYLDLIEETIKYILDVNNISYDASKTCGKIVKDQLVFEFFMKMGLDEYNYNKIIDYIKKCNDHKHKKEKSLSIESIINYLQVYFNFINCYYRYIKVDEIVYDVNYFFSIYKETEKINEKYKSEVLNLKKELEEAYNNNLLTKEMYLQCDELLSINKLEKYDLEKQNSLLESQILVLSSIKENVNISKKLEKIEKLNQELLETVKLQNKINDNNNNNDIEQENAQKFLLSSKKEYIWFGSDFTFNNLKVKLKILCIVSLLLGLVLTIINTISFGFYSTYSLFENIWMIFIIIIFVNNGKMKLVMSDVDLYKISSFSSTYNDLAYWKLEKEKFSYKLFRRLSYIASLATMLCYLLGVKEVSIFVFILEGLFIICSFILTLIKNNIQKGYTRYVRYIGKKGNDDKVHVLLYNVLEEEFYDYEEYVVNYDFLKH